MPTRRTMSTGRLKKNGSSSLNETSPSQSASAAKPTTPCQATTAAPLGERAYARPSATAYLGVHLTLHHLAAQDAPHGPVKVDERRRGAELHHIAWTIERHRVARDDTAGGTGRENDDFVGQRNRFLEVVSDEEHRLSIVSGN